MVSATLDERIVAHARKRVGARPSVLHRTAAWHHTSLGPVAHELLQHLDRTSA